MNTLDVYILFVCCFLCWGVEYVLRWSAMPGPRLWPAVNTAFIGVVIIAYSWLAFDLITHPSENQPLSDGEAFWMSFLLYLTLALGIVVVLMRLARPVHSLLLRVTQRR